MAQQANKQKETLHNIVMQMAVEASQSKTNEAKIKKLREFFTKRLGEGSSKKEVLNAVATLKDSSVSLPLSKFVDVSTLVAEAKDMLEM